MEYQPHTNPSNSFNQRQSHSMKKQDIGSTIKKKKTTTTKKNFERVRETILNQAENKAMFVQSLPMV